jgi:hypothetical protein
MNSQNNRFNFRHAVPKDAEDILSILEEEPSTGSISLIYTRRRDPYRSLLAEGNEVDLIVCEDLQLNKVIGLGGIAFNEMFVNGKRQLVGYLFGLRLLSSYRKYYFLIHHAYNILRETTKSKNVNFYYTTILSDNFQAQKLLEKPRKFMPLYQPWGNYHVHAFKINRKKKKYDDFHFTKVSSSDQSELINFMHREGSKRQFFPVIHTDKQSKAIPGGIQFYALRDSKNEIVAGCALWNQQNYKQYIVHSYQGILKIIYPLASRLALAGFPRLPKVNSILNFFTLSFWAVKDHQPDYFRMLLDHVTSVEPDYSFYLVGIHESDPLRKVLESKKHISYKSKVYLVDWDHSVDPASKLNQSYIPYLECGLL